jgi:hypothetical protein
METTQDDLKKTTKAGTKPKQSRFTNTIVRRSKLEQLRKAHEKESKLKQLLEVKKSDMEENLKKLEKAKSELDDMKQQYENICELQDQLKEYQEGIMNNSKTFQTKINEIMSEDENEIFQQDLSSDKLSPEKQNKSEERDHERKDLGKQTENFSENLSTRNETEKTADLSSKETLDLSQTKTISSEQKNSETKINSVFIERPNEKVTPIIDLDSDSDSEIIIRRKTVKLSGNIVKNNEKIKDHLEVNPAKEKKMEFHYQKGSSIQPDPSFSLGHPRYVPPLAHQHPSPIMTSPLDLSNKSDENSENSASTNSSLSDGDFAMNMSMSKRNEKNQSEERKLTLIKISEKLTDNEIDRNQTSETEMETENKIKRKMEGKQIKQTEKNSKNKPGRPPLKRPTIEELECPECENRTFGRFPNLKKHMRLYHDPNWGAANVYVKQCSRCDFQTKLTTQMNNHIKTKCKKGIFYYKCLEKDCNEQKVVKIDWLRHMTQAHKILPDSPIIQKAANTPLPSDAELKNGPSQILKYKRRKEGQPNTLQKNYSTKTISEAFNLIKTENIIIDLIELD